MATPQENAAKSAQNLNVSFTPNTGGDPQITRSDLVGGKIITGADGKEYYFAPRDYVNKGFLHSIDGKPYQMYNSRFLDGGVFKNAQQFTSPEGVPGFVWKKQDALNSELIGAEGDSRVGGYYITGDEPAIIGIGNPNATRDDHLGLMAYVTVPRRVSDQMVQQDYITDDGSSNGLHWDGNRGYEYVLKGWVPDMLRKSLPTVNAVMPIVMEVLAPGTGAGATYATWSAGTAATIEALRTGNVEKGVVDLAKIYAVGQVSDLINSGVSAYMPTLELSKAATAILGGAGTNAIVQGLYGKDVGKAFIDGGIAAGIGSVAGSISGFSQLPVPIQRVFAAAVTTSLQGKSQKDIDAASLQAAITSGLGAIANGLEANSKIQKELGREATAEELNNFIWYEKRDAAFNNKVYDYMGGVKKDISLQNGFDTYTLDGNDYKIPTAELDTFAKTQDWDSWSQKQYAADKLGIDTKGKYQEYQDASEAFKKEGYNATQEQIKEYIGYKGDTDAVGAIQSKFDPLATTSDEAAEFFRTQGYTPTPEELQQYVGNKAEVDTSRDISAYADPLATMADEATTFFKKEGYVPTEEELKNYVGNKAEVDTSRDISAYADPRAVTEEEARAQYLAQGIPDPTREELDKYIQQRTESEVLGELDKFADPLGTTAQEARAFAEKYSLNPDSIDNLAALTSERTSELGSRESLGEYSNALRSTDPEYYGAQDRAYKYALSRGQSEEEARTFADGYAKNTLGRDAEVGARPTLSRDAGEVMFGGQEGSENYTAAPGTRLATLEEVMADQTSGAGKTYYDADTNAWVTGIAPDIGDLGPRTAVTTKDLVDYQSGDGSFRIPNPDGSYHMYSSQGVYMGVYTGNDAFMSYEPELSPFDVKPDFDGYPIQDFGGGEAENMDSFNDAMKSIMEERGGFPVGWQQVGTDRIFVYDDGTGIGMNENGDPYELGEDDVTRMVDNGLLNTAASGYEFGSDADPESNPWYKNIPGFKIPTSRAPKSKTPSGPRDPGPRDSTVAPDPLNASSPTSALQAAGSEKAQGSTLGKIPGSWVGGLGRPVSFIDPLSATESDLPGQEESEDMYSTSPLAAATPRREEELSLQPEVSYYSYGYEPSFSSIIQPYKNPSSPYAKGGGVMNSPLMAAQGGDVPHKGSHYVQGAGGGQDDLIDAKLADGEYVLDAEIVASLGDGSNKRGAEILDKWRRNIRKHKRSASVDGIPPKAKSPLGYMKGIK